MEKAIEDAKAFLAHSKQELEIALAHLRNIIAHHDGVTHAATPEEAPAPTSEETPVS